MKKTFWIMLMALLVSGTAFAQLDLGGKGKEKKSDLTAKVPLDKKIRYGKLDNGFTYYVRNNKKPEKMIQFRLVSNAGSIMERDDQQGLAHFCEHMAFNGIKCYPGNQMIDKLQQHGVEFGRDINAYTSFDQTVYYVNMPADDPEMVKMGIEILDGWAGNILFDQKEIEEERGVIHEEWRGGVGHGDRLRKKTWPIMLKGSLYADRLPIGKEEVIMNFKRQSIVDFFNDWYRPDLQAIVIVGDLDNFEYASLKGDRAMEQKVKDVFSSHKFLGKEKLPRLSYEIPDNKDPLVAIATDKEAPAPPSKSSGNTRKVSTAPSVPTAPCSSAASSA
jgi:zinc protease